MPTCINILHGRQVAEDHVHSMHRVGADGLVQLQGFWHPTTSQDLMKQVPADQRHKLDADLEGPVLPSLSWQSNIQVDLQYGSKETKPLGF